jgi:GMP synthase (glutamine-hydrolysing)
MDRKKKTARKPAKKRPPAHRAKRSTRSLAKLPVLIVQHAPHEHPAAVRRALESQGISTHWIHPYRGEHYPGVDEIAGMISLGGPMGANDEGEFPWIKEEIELLRQSVESDLPTVGICLGGQMLAKALGGKVENNHTHEVGWFSVEVNADGLRDPVIGAAGSHPVVYHWHGDTFHLPPGAVLLAKSSACDRQAYRYGNNAYGFQFHPEADHQLVLEWLAIEGVEDEIHATRRSHGFATVQDAATQREEASRGEKGSLKITAAIGSLFRTKKFKPVSGPAMGRILGWIERETLLSLEFKGSLGKPAHITGRILHVLAIAAGEFVIFQEETTLLWPIRTCDITDLTPIEQ